LKYRIILSAAYQALDSCNYTVHIEEESNGHIPRNDVLEATETSTVRAAGTNQLPTGASAVLESFWKTLEMAEGIDVIGH
jgi:hypothetical protein